MKTVERAYTDLHEGRAPDKMLRETVPARPKRLWTIGRVTQIGYRKTIPDDQLTDADRREAHRDGVLFKHDFAAHAQPLLVRDEHGKLWIFRGKNFVSDEGKLGITDLPRSQQTAETLPPPAKSFVDLGKLSWIRYRRDYEGRRETAALEFDGASAPILAHHAGDLWLLRGNYKNLEGTESTMAHKVSRANPAEKATMGEKAKAVVLSSAGVGGVGLLTIFGLEYITPKLIKAPVGATIPATTAGVNGATVTAPASIAPLTPQQAASVEYKRAALSGVLALGAAVGVFLGVKSEGTAGHVAATVSGGLGAGAVIDAGMRIRNGYMATRRPATTDGSVRSAGYVMPSLPEGYKAIYSTPSYQPMYMVKG